MSEPVTFLNGRVTLHAGDCRDVLKTFADNSIDSVCCDPPYALVSIVKRFGKAKAETEDYAQNKSKSAYMSRGFMGKAWDNGEAAFAVEFWAEVLRVLKPGGHVAAFSGTRTYHRLACAIEDAGFEIRDSLQYLYGVGFPKSHNVGKSLDASHQRCSCDSPLRSVRENVGSGNPLSGGQEQDVFRDLCGNANLSEKNGRSVASQSKGDDKLRSVRKAENGSSSLAAQGAGEHILQSRMSREGGVRPGFISALAQGPCGLDECEHGVVFGENDRADKPGMERRCDVSQAQGQLREREICSMSDGIGCDGEGRWLRDGTSSRDGEMDRPLVVPDRMRPSQGSQPAEQPEVEPRTVARQSESQERRAWDNCQRCGKPIVPDGLGTALKPACEPICLARKPLSEKTVAANVLRWGTGALNIDATRIGFQSGKDQDAAKPGGRATGKPLSGLACIADERAPFVASDNSAGRWPANLLHDGSAEVLAGFPEVGAGSDSVRRCSAKEPSVAKGREYYRESVGHSDGAGSAARFFYSAKADSDDRIGSKHPTVKPVDLMQWLVRLITPPNGVTLDPFAGTGTCGEAAWREGFSAILVEREAEYQADIARRMEYALAGPDARKHAIMKAKGKVEQAGPLFEGVS